jgi:ubiquinone biosynthesis protein UbiJ
MPAPQILTAALEATINQALKWSSNSAELLVPLSNKVCIIFIQELKAALIFRFTGTMVSVGADIDNVYSEAPSDEGQYALMPNECWVSISLFALDKLKQNNQMTKLIKSGKLDFAGDLGILQSVSGLFGKIDIDVEEVLSMYVGDAASHEINSSGKKLASTLKQQITLLSQTLADAALDEKPVGIRPIMLLNFVDDVSALQADVERLEAKLERLELKSTLSSSEKGKSL